MAKQKKYQDDFAEFWASVAHWRAQLVENHATEIPASIVPHSSAERASDGGPGNGSLNRLENAWAQCSQFAEWSWLRERDAARRVSKDPLGALFGYVDMGLYPPPEILLAAMQCFARYMDAEGGIDLESAFFGKPVQRVGNFAKRSSQRQRDFDIGFRVAIKNKEGQPDSAAAETTANELEGEGTKLDADTVLAIANRVMPRVSRKK